MIWLFQFAKTGRIKTLGEARKAFQKLNGRPPSLKEMKSMENILREATGKTANIIQFPKDRITDWWKPRPTGPTEEVVTASPDRIRKGFSTVMKLNSPDENQRLLKSFIRRENAEFNSLNREQQKEIFDMFDTWAKKPDMASGGIARVGMLMGGPVWKKFIEGLFIKTSNQIRQGKGKWAGLTQDQWIKQHDDLTKMLKKWEMGGKKGLPQGAEQFIGMNDLQVTKAIKGATKKVDDEKLMQTAYDEIKGGSGFSGDYKYDADILAEEYARQHGKVFADLPQDQISIYYDPALKRVSQDLLKRREARKALKDVHQKVELQMFDTKGRKPNAYGGIAGELHLNQGGRVSFTKGGKVSSGLAHVLGV